MQAIDRVHRMGQKRPVRVYRFVMKDTVEERMLTIQGSKAALGKGTMKKLSCKYRKVDAMLMLCNIANQETLLQLSGGRANREDDTSKRPV